MMIKKNFDKAPTISINGEIVKVWNNGEYGSIEMRNGNVEFKPYNYDEVTGEVLEYIDDRHPNIVLATGFTVYQYSHPDDADSMQHYYDMCKEEYKATLKYKAYYNEKIFAAVHIKDEAGKAETSKVLYEYVEDNELKELTERYLCWIRDEDEQNMATELTSFYEGVEAKWSASSLAKYLYECNRKAEDIAARVKLDIDTRGFIKKKAKHDFWNIVSVGYHRLNVSDETWRKRINEQIEKE